jgi:hypothetical protein
MPAYAMVVVVEGVSADHAGSILDKHLDEIDVPQALFVGEPWEVQPLNSGGGWMPRDEREFDTISCIDQHPER